MGYLDTTYTGGVIAAREKYLLKDKIFRLCELTAEEAFRLLLDSGFGGGAETATCAYEYEKTIAVEEEKIDAFIREFAPSKTEKAYLLSPRDFHNAKALVKAAYLNESAERMLTGEGLASVETLRNCVNTSDFSVLENVFLKEACEKATELLREEPSGAKVGEIFEKALYAYLLETVKFRPVLKKLLVAKADMTNILVAFRCGDKEIARGKYLPAGKLTEETLSAIFEEDSARTKAAFKKTAYGEFLDLCLEAKERGLPFTQAERMLESYDTTYFAERKYELKKSEPFLYYIYRRKAECANVRVVFACLSAGLREQDIKRRLRAF
ncbi:MAG: V-type ATPase subunit [Clostridia bacterium]|nr:V-type ATPase subunit [Clostridia bacterium]